MGQRFSAPWVNLASAETRITIKRQGHIPQTARDVGFPIQGGQEPVERGALVDGAIGKKLLLPLMEDWSILFCAALWVKQGESSQII